MLVAIIDYGMGNLRSVQKALEKVGAQTVITHTPMEIAKADKVVLPGVGAMAPAMARLHELGLTDVIRRIIREGKPFLGICLGLQLLFDRSSEGGFSQGLGIIKGSVERFPHGNKVPHMGWNQLKVQTAGKGLCAGLNDGDNVYFCHSYYVKPQDMSIAATTTTYGIEYVSAVAINKLWGVQFHPEKSQSVGLKILSNFTQL